MNNKLTFLIAFSWLTLNASAQTVSHLRPYTKGNRIDLTIANESQTALAEQVEVKAIHYPQGITFKNVIQTVESVPPQGDRTVSFTFDVGYPSKIGNNSTQRVELSTDTLKFLISDGSGATWEKSIIVMYASPASFALEQNFPNPFNPTTTINYQLPEAAHVTIKVYDVLGREVKTLVNGPQQAGYYQISVNFSSAASGVYFYRMLARSLSGGTAGNYTSVKKLLLMK